MPNAVALGEDMDMSVSVLVQDESWTISQSNEKTSDGGLALVSGKVLIPLTPLSIFTTPK